jgi:hypothetical protein
MSMSGGLSTFGICLETVSEAGERDRFRMKGAAFAVDDIEVLDEEAICVDECRNDEFSAGWD